MTTTSHDDRRPSRWGQGLTWAGGGAAAGGGVMLACGACAAVPLATVAGVAGGLGLLAGGVGFALAGGSAVALGAMAAARRTALPDGTGARGDCCTPRVDDARSASRVVAHSSPVSNASSPLTKEKT